MLVTTTFVVFSNSSLNIFAKPVRANFDTEYAPQYARGVFPTLELVNIILPSTDFFNNGNKALVKTNTEVKFVCMTDAHSLES